MNNLMIDLETMGTGKNAMIIAIGAVFFDPMTGELGKEFEMKINWQSCLNIGLEIEPDTVMWWLRQERSAIDKLFGISYDIREVLKEFSAFIRAHSKGSVLPWGNGATFDIALLENAFDAINMHYPWKFYNIRDCRTVVDLASGIVEKDSVPFKGIKHHALSDAKYQAEYISKMIKALVE